MLNSSVVYVEASQYMPILEKKKYIKQGLEKKPYRFVLGCLPEKKSDDRKAVSGTASIL